MNVAVSLLRILSIYCVIAVHAHGNFARTDVAVPLFMSLSFYFSGDKLVTGSNLNRRLIRIGIPFCGWGIIYSVYALFSNHEFGWWWLRGMIEQLLLGHTFAPHLYFLWLLASYTIVLWLIGQFSQGKAMWWFGIFAFLCLILQWTGINFSLCDRLPYFMRYTIGRFVELMPYAFIGCFAGNKCCISCKLRWSLIALLAIGIMMVKILGRHIVVKGFGYSTFWVYLFVPICMLSLDYASHLVRKFLPKTEWLNFMGGLVPGVYFIHLLFVFMLSDYISEGLSLIVFLLSFLAVALLSRVPALRMLVR